MSGKHEPDMSDRPSVASKALDAGQKLALHAEKLEVTTRVRRTMVRASRTSAIRQEAVSVDLKHEHIIVERVAVGRVVESVPPLRQEGDVTIMPVIEEELVVVRRLILKEEVHLRRVRSVTTHSEIVDVREQQVSVTRTALDD